MSLSTMDTASETPELDQLVPATGDMEIARDAAGKTTKEAEDRVRKETLLLDLNDDCLLKILSFLPKDDLISIRLTNSRFKPLFLIVANRRYTFGCFSLNKKNLKKYPLSTSMAVYRVIGELCEHLDIDDVDDKELHLILPCFPRVASMNIDVKKLKNKKSIELFPLLTSLDIKAGDTDRSYLTALFLRLASTLETLDCKETPRADFSMLKNVKHLEINGEGLGKKTNFWKTNKTLETLTIQSYENEDDALDQEEIFHDFDIVRDNLRAIAGMETVWMLAWNGIGVRNLRAGIIPHFKHQTDLCLDFTEHLMILPVFNHFGSKVTTLQVCHLEFNENRRTWVEMLKVIGKNFPLLENIIFQFFSTFSEEETRPLYALKNLNQINMNLKTRAATYALFRNLPNLKYVEDQRFAGYGSDDEGGEPVPQDFIEFLKKEKRSVSICNKHYP